MSNPLKIAAPPRRRTVMEVDPAPEPEAESEAAVAPAVKASPAAAPAKFRQVKEDERVQFNKRVTRRVADGFEMLAIRTRVKLPELLAEALEVLEERYGKV